MNIKESLGNTYRPMEKAKVTSIHETPTGELFGCKGKDYECPNKRLNGSIKYPGLCLECPRFIKIKEN